MVCPCAGPVTSVRRISMSSVPCTISELAVSDLFDERSTISPPLECLGEHTPLDGLWEEKKGAGTGGIARLLGFIPSGYPNLGQSWNFNPPGVNVIPLHA